MKRKLLLFVSVSLAFFFLAVSDVRADLLRVRLARTAPQGDVTPELQDCGGFAAQFEFALLRIVGHEDDSLSGRSADLHAARLLD